MLLGLLLLITVLTVWTWSRWDTVSPKLLVRESATIVGSVVGATPEVARTGVKLAKAANAASEVALREAGEDGPVGYNVGRITAAKATRDLFKEVNQEADDLRRESLAKLAAMKEAAEAKSSK